MCNLIVIYPSQRGRWCCCRSLRKKNIRPDLPRRLMVVTLHIYSPGYIYYFWRIFLPKKEIICECNKPEWNAVTPGYCYWKNGIVIPVIVLTGQWVPVWFMLTRLFDGLPGFSQTWWAASRFFKKVTGPPVLFHWLDAPGYCFICPHDASRLLFTCTTRVRLLIRWHLHNARPVLLHACQCKRPVIVCQLSSKSALRTAIFNSHLGAYFNNFNNF